MGKLYTLSKTFTLVEFLISIAILMILGTLLLPILKKVQDKAKYGRWMCHDAVLEADDDLVAYYSFQEQEGAELNNQTTGPVHDPLYKPENLNGTINGTSWVNGRWSGKGALSFNGSTDYVRFDNKMIQDSSEVTMIAWVKPDVEAWTSEGSIFSHGPTGIAKLSCYTWQDKPGFSFSFYDTPSTGVGLIGIEGVQNAWNHVAGTWEKGRHYMKIYINGELKNTGSTGAREMYDFGNSVKSAIGAYQSSGGIWHNFFKGEIDEVVIYDRLLSAKEIKEHFDMGNPK